MNEDYPKVTVFITTNDIIFIEKGVNYISYKNRLMFHKDNGSSPTPTCGLLPLSNKTQLY